MNNVHDITYPPRLAASLVVAMEGGERTSCSIRENRTIYRDVSLEYTCECAFLFGGGCAKVLEIDIE